jgi:hypothetical protein
MSKATASLRWARLVLMLRGVIADLKAFSPEAMGLLEVCDEAGVQKLLDVLHSEKTLLHNVSELPVIMGRIHYRQAHFSEAEAAVMA